jgi:hypothetical protein
MLLVEKKDVTARMGLVTRYAWQKARDAGKLRPVKTAFEYGRNKYLARHVEEVFGLPAGSVSGVRSALVR